jgi:glucan phosphoethanolaminetransferase (alkaline phosphatase superfamily)
VDLEAHDARRHHPFGRGANVFVLAGTTLSIIQSLVVAIAAVVAPLEEGFELTGVALLLWILVAVGLPVLVGWTAWRALRSWWRRSVRVVPRILVAAVLAVPSMVLLQIPLGDELFTPIGYLPAGVMMAIGAVLARPRVAAAEREGRGGLAD